MKASCLMLFLFLFYTYSCCSGSQVDKLQKLIRSKRSSENHLYGEASAAVDETDIGNFKQAWIGPQRGLRKADKVHALPGQPKGVDFDQYAGYVTVDPKAGRELFYYFVESPHKSSSKPLVLWLNGGPGCSSLGYGAMQEVGPFRVKRDRKTLFQNEYAWNKVANVLFLESPAGVGFSYSNSSTDYQSAGDKSTAEDSYTFLLNWLERFPHYKTRDLFIAGESYAGHYIPQLAHLIVSRNRKTSHTTIKLKGIVIGNAWIDDNTGTKGVYDYLWTHALNSDETYAGIQKYCDFITGNLSSECTSYLEQGNEDIQDIDLYNIYAPLCNLPDAIYYAVTDQTSDSNSGTSDSVNKIDPCSDIYVESYLNREEVQRAIHVKGTKRSACSDVLEWNDSQLNILPTIKKLSSSGIRIWLYSGDTDSVVPITSTKYAMKALKLPVETAWQPWQSRDEVGGYVVGYKGITLITVRGAGHMVPSNQPERSLTLISSFLRGRFP